MLKKKLILKQMAGTFVFIIAARSVAVVMFKTGRSIKISVDPEPVQETFYVIFYTRRLSV